jgi:hypothetical protein
MGRQVGTRALRATQKASESSFDFRATKVGKALPGEGKAKGKGGYKEKFDDKVKAEVKLAESMGTGGTKEDREKLAKAKERSENIKKEEARLEKHVKEARVRNDAAKQKHDSSPGVYTPFVPIAELTIAERQLESTKEEAKKHKAKYETAKAKTKTGRQRSRAEALKHARGYWGIGKAGTSRHSMDAAEKIEKKTKESKEMKKLIEELGKISEEEMKESGGNKEKEDKT